MIPNDIEKILEHQFLRYIDTTPSSQTATWKVIGIGVDEGNGAISYNPNVERNKWIIENAARSEHKSNDKQMRVSQKTYKNDPAFEFVNSGRDVLNYKTHILEIDTWDVATGSSYKAKKTDAIIAITSYSGDVIEYDLYFDGDPKNGTVTIANGVPTFTESAL